MTKQKKSTRTSYFVSNSQRKKVGKKLLLLNSKRFILAATLIVAGSLLAGLYLVQQSNRSEAAVDVPMTVSCTQTISTGSISSAVNSLSSGQTLCISGTFNQSVNITKAGVGLASAPGQTAKIIGQLKISQGANDVRIMNLYLNGNGIIVSPHVLANNAYFYGNQVTNDSSSTRGICFAIGETDLGVEVQGITIDSNRIFKCGDEYHDQGIYAEYVRNAVIRNNYIYDNPDFGIQFYPSAQNSIFEYNVLDNNKRGLTFSSEGGTINKTSSGNIVRYNIITNSPDAYNLNYWWGGPVGTGNKVENNCLYNGGKGNIQPGLTNYITVAGTVTADPLYVNRGAKDFRLNTGSPCAAMGPRSSVSPTPPAPAPAPVPTPSPTDNTAPMVSLTGPNDGSTVAGSLIISANASDNVGVTRVQFRVNGNAVNSADTTSPYSTGWDTRTVANGSYTLSAAAYDAAGNSAISTSRTVRVDNSVIAPAPAPSPSPSPSPSPTPSPGTVIQQNEAEKSTYCTFKRTSSTLCSNSVWTWSASGATGGKFVSLTNSNDSILQSFSIPSNGNYKIGFTARDEEYRGHAKIDLYIDGSKEASEISLTESWEFRSIDKTLSSGLHNLKLVFLNDKCGNTFPRESCNGSNDRNVWVDQFRLIKL